MNLCGSLKEPLLCILTSAGTGKLDHSHAAEDRLLCNWCNESIWDANIKFRYEHGSKIIDSRIHIKSVLPRLGSKRGKGTHPISLDCTAALVTYVILNCIVPLTTYHACKIFGPDTKDKCCDSRNKNNRMRTAHSKLLRRQIRRNVRLVPVSCFYFKPSPLTRSAMHASRAPW